MLSKRKISAHRFEADQLGVDQLKNDFFAEARKFSYFRKGEWTGVEASIEFAREFAQEYGAYVSVAIAMYRPTKAFVTDLVKVTGASARAIRSFFGNRKKGHVTRRVITSGGTVTRAQIAEWEAICGRDGVALIPKSQAGAFRYLVNEKRYAIFSRLGENDLRGIIGRDRKTIEMLREQFDREFIEASIRRRRRRRGG